MRSGYFMYGHRRVICHFLKGILCLQNGPRFDGRDRNEATVTVNSTFDFVLKIGPMYMTDLD